LRERDQTEIIIVDDDSQDGTVEQVQQLHEEGYQVELLVRKNENGLSSAVLRGFEVARGHKLVVMDADLQVSSFSRRITRFEADQNFT
jgi:dolichol-phosphate mannosyltransferase